MSIAYLYERHPLADSTGCVALWRTVIYRALCDACYQFFDAFMMEKHSLANAGPQHITPENWRYAQDARRFLLADERGFRDICICADIDPGYLRRRARRVINDVDLMVKAVRLPLFAPGPIVARGSLHEGQPSPRIPETARRPAICEVAHESWTGG